VAGIYLCRFGVQIPLGSKPKNATTKEILVGVVFFFYIN